ncbi:hypothetical protein HHI36_013882 [Cryptolaemus montrouzieri]|uniref:Uncharacterized protein n=1 Tax=Cryptolaemus montrouzieri TaxID=559131 RepID=A0ABD2N130_9CUCU
MKKVIEGLFWTFVLVFFAFGIAGFCSPFYIVVYFFEAFVPDIQPLSDILLQGLQLPHYCAKRVLDIILSRTDS